MEENQVTPDSEAVNTLHIKNDIRIKKEIIEDSNPQEILSEIKPEPICVIENIDTISDYQDTPLIAEKHDNQIGLQCPQCSKHYRSTSCLRAHLKTHSEEKPHACPQCDRRFREITPFKIHLRTHTGERPYACTVCDKRFIQNGTLTVHMTTHTGEKPHRCRKCGKRFSRLGHYKRHLKTHTGEKAWQCLQCLQRFTQSTGLNKHMMIHTGEKPYTCGECGKRFSTPYHHKRHLKVHARYANADASGNEISKKPGKTNSESKGSKAFLKKPSISETNSESKSKGSKAALKKPAKTNSKSKRSKTITKNPAKTISQSKRSKAISKKPAKTNAQSKDSKESVKANKKPTKRKRRDCNTNVVLGRNVKSKINTKQLATTFSENLLANIKSEIDVCDIKQEVEDVVPNVLIVTDIKTDPYETPIIATQN